MAILLQLATAPTRVQRRVEGPLYIRLTRAGCRNFLQLTSRFKRLCQNLNLLLFILFFDLASNLLCIER
jgi:hypothetical protein